MRSTFLTIAFVIFIVACDPQHLSIEEIEYEPSTEQVIQKYTDVYNFEKIELVYVRNSQTQSYELVIKGTNGDLPTSHEGRDSLQKSMCPEIFFTLDPAYRQKISVVDCSLSENDNQLFFSSGISYIFTYRVVDDQLMPIYTK